VNDHCKALLLELEEQLKYIALETDNPLSSAELSFQVVQNNLKNLKQFIVKYKFKSIAEEIFFFKELKPTFCSKLFYHISIYNIETRNPSGEYKVIKKYLQKELDKLKHYFDNKPVIVLYYGLKKKVGLINSFFFLFMIEIWFSAIYAGHQYVQDVMAGHFVQ